MKTEREREREGGRVSESGSGNYIPHLNLFPEKVPDMIFVLFMVLLCPV
jgi:hypothetical protein